jgi:uncharacterized membrane protein
LSGRGWSVAYRGPPNEEPNVMRHLKAYFGTLIAFVALDAVWLFLVAGTFFKGQLGPLLRAEPDLVAASVFYAVYAAGLVVLVVAPALQVRSAMTAAWRGAVLGLTAYATFDLTNLAIIEGWTIAVAVVDIAWGIIGSMVAALVGYQFSPPSTRDRQERV